MRKGLWLLILILIAGSLLWWQTRPHPVTVQVHTLDRGAVEETVSNTRSGTLKACRRSRLSLLTGGTVSRLLVHEGDHVSAGQLLLELWNEDRQAQVARAEATLERTRKDALQACSAAERDARELARQRQLAAKGLTSEDVLDRLSTQAEVSALTCDARQVAIREAEAELTLQRALLAQTRLLAPFDGIVAEINGEVGEYVTPSPPGVATPPAVDLFDEGCQYVTAPIDEVDISRIRLNAPVRITLDAWRDRTFAGTVQRLAPYVQDREKQARTLDVDVRFNNPPADIVLRPGLSADIEIQVQRRENVLRVPTDLILEGNAVWRLDPVTSTIHKITFTPGIGNWTWTEVRDGLQPGDQIVRNLDAEGLEDGAVVRLAHD